MEIDIRITEILSRIITITNASSLEDALVIVEGMYRKENIVLDYTDFSGNVIIEEKVNGFKSKKDLLINEIIQYLIIDEKKHYEESDKPNEHIYLTLLELQKYIE